MPTAQEVRSLISQAQTVLLQRRDNTTDPDERAALQQQILDLHDQTMEVSLTDLAGRAAILNQLADTLEAAVANLRSRPFDHILGQIEDIFDRIGLALGEAAREIRLPRTDSPSRPVIPGSPPAAPQEEARVTSAAPHPVTVTVTEGDAGLESYVALFGTCAIRPERGQEIDRLYIQPLLTGRPRYETVSQPLGIPWWFTGIIHGLESSFSFETHLHNGDPLTARTRNVPAGRPTTGQPPFAWTESARDALTFEGFDGLADWSLGRTLRRFEEYNGLGYQRRGIPSPYLWSFSNHYTKGKFVADGVFDPEAVSKQCGAAVMLKRLVEQGIVTVQADQPNAGPAPVVAAVPAHLRMAVSKSVVPEFAADAARKELEFPGPIRRGMKDQRRQLTVRRVQEWCTFHKADTGLDGDFGTGTESAVKRFQRAVGLPDTGVVDERTWLELTAPMRRVLAPLALGGDEVLYDVVLAVARQHLAEHPVEFQVRGEGNCGPWVRLYMNGLEGEQQLWCAGFTCFLVGQAATLRGEAMPIKRQVGVDALVSDAKADARFIAEADIATGQLRRNKLRPGCIFVVRKTPDDWTHTGVVTQVGSESFETVEGNTNDEGSSNGFEVCARSRGYSKRDFVLLF